MVWDLGRGGCPAGRQRLADRIIAALALEPTGAAKRPAGTVSRFVCWSGGETHLSFCVVHGRRLADDPPKLGCDAVQHRALLLHPLGVIVDLTGDAGHDLLLLLARGVIETLRDPRIVKAEVARQGRRRPAQIVRRERPQTEQRADAGRLHLALGLACRAARLP